MADFLIQSKSTKASPDGNDLLLVADSADSYDLKNVLISSLNVAAVGELHTDTTTAMTLTTQNTWYGYTQAASTVAENVTADVASATADSLSPDTDYDGLYLIAWSGSIYKASSGTDVIEVALAIDGTIVDRTIIPRSIDFGATGAVASFTVASLSAGEEVALYVRCTSSAGGQVQIYYANVIIIRVSS